MDIAGCKTVVSVFKKIIMVKCIVKAMITHDVAQYFACVDVTTTTCCPYSEGHCRRDGGR